MDERERPVEMLRGIAATFDRHDLDAITTQFVDEIRMPPAT